MTFLSRYPLRQRYNALLDTFQRVSRAMCKGYRANDRKLGRNCTRSVSSVVSPLYSPSSTLLHTYLFYVLSRARPLSRKK